MTVTHFNRDPRSGNYTFEQLFGCLREELAKYAEIRSCDLPAGMNYFDAIRWAKRHAGSINHITGDINYLAYGLPPKRTIITVHDLGHYTRSLSGWKKWIYKKMWLDGPLDRVIKITAISDFTKNELMQVLGVPEHKITVIPDPLLPGFEYAPKSTMHSKPLIMQIGSGSNKNLSRLIEAVAGLDVRLLLINRLNDSNLKKRMAVLKIDYEQRIDLDFESLKQAYRDCDILFFASEYEGFGMPILEAQAIGRPVITSNLASMPEAAGEGGAIFVDPYSVESIRAVINHLITSSVLRQELIEVGLENVRKYSIQDVAQSYLKLYRSFE